MAEIRNQPVDTKERILGAAEFLFMEYGYAATSLRMITAKAAVNLAAVNYHFGSKETLIRELFGRRLGPLNAARIAELDKMERAACGGPLAIEQIIHAIIAPPSHARNEPLTTGAIFLRLLGRAFSEPNDTLRKILPAQYRQVVMRFKQAFVKSLPQMPDQELTWRMHFMFGALSYTMAGNDTLQLLASCNLEEADDANSIMQRLIPFLAAGLQAPLPTSQTRSDVPGQRVA